MEGSFLSPSFLVPLCPCEQTDREIARYSWVGYRSAKAATNQVIMTLQRELSVRSTPAITVALHPGTVPGTNLSSAFTKPSDAGKHAGVLTAEDSSGRLLDVIKGLGIEDGGKFLDWDGKEIVW